MRKNTTVSLVALICFVFVFSSCFFDKKKTGWEYVPDMVHSVAGETYDANSNFPDSTEAQMPVKGTIPRGVYMPFHYAPPPSMEGYALAGKEVHPPFSATPDTLAEGQHLFTIYCAICHGDDGNASGTIVKNGKFPATPPSYFSDRLLTLPIGEMFYSVHYGKNMMGSYAAQLDQRQVWEVLLYVRNMQKDYVAKNAYMVADSVKKKYAGGSF